MAVTVADVRKVYTTDLEDSILQVHLDTAELVVSEQLTCGMSQERLDKITIYLTAHFAEASDLQAAGLPGQVRRSKLGDADESYAVPQAQEGVSGYMTTRWGQLAIALDTCNALLTTGNGKLKAQFEVY